MSILQNSIYNVPIRWKDIGVSTSITLFGSTGYFTSSPVPVLFTLPSGALFGDMYSIMGYATGHGFTIITSGSQSIRWLNTVGSHISANDSAAGLTILCLGGAAGSQIFTVLSTNDDSSFTIS
jgi:hypothetical protein